MYYRGAQAAIVVYDITNTVKIFLLYSLPFISVKPQELDYKSYISGLPLRLLFPTGIWADFLFIGMLS